MQLLTDLLIFQSKMGVALVEVKREDHFKHERRVIFLYGSVYFAWLLSVFGLISYALTQIQSPENFIEFNNYTWFYFNISTNSMLICWLCFYYLRFVLVSRKMYNVVYQKYRLRWCLLFSVTLLTLFMVLSMLIFYYTSSPLNANEDDEASQ